LSTSTGRYTSRSRRSWNSTKPSGIYGADSPQDLNTKAYNTDRKKKKQREPLRGLPLFFLRYRDILPGVGHADIHTTERAFLDFEHVNDTICVRLKIPMKGANVP
jgi:hypothetical protein